MKSIAYVTTALAFAGAIAMMSPVRADEMQVTGTNWLTNVETHMISAPDDSTRGIGIEKFVGASSAPGWFDSMQLTVTESFQINAKLGQGKATGAFFLVNSEGTLAGSFIGKAAIS